MGEFQPVVHQEIERNGEVLDSFPLEITANLLVDLELATLEVAREIGGKKFAKDLAQQPDTEVWSPTTFKLIDRMRDAKAVDTTETPQANLADLIIDRAAELQHGRKPRKSLGEKVLSSLQVKEAGSEVKSSEESEPTDIKPIEGLENWSATDNAVKELLAKEAAVGELRDYTSKIILEPFDGADKNLDSSDIISRRIYTPYYEQAKDYCTQERKQAADKIFQELLDKARERKGSGWHELPVDEDTIKPVATLLSMVAYARTSPGYDWHLDFLAKTEKVASAINDYAESKHGLVYSKQYGITVKNDFALSLHGSGRTGDDFPSIELGMQVLTGGYKNPRVLKGVSVGVWDTYAREDIFSLTSRIADSEVRAIKNEDLSDGFRYAEHIVKVDDSVATLTAHYVGRLDEMPKLSEETEQMLQEKFGKDVLQPVDRTVFEMAVNLAGGPWGLDEINKITSDTSFQMDVVPEAFDEAKQLQRQILSRYKVKDQELVNADLQLRGIDSEALRQSITTMAKRVLSGNYYGQDERVLAEYSNNWSVMAKNIFGQDFEFDFKDFLLNASRSEQITYEYARQLRQRFEQRDRERAARNQGRQ